MLHPCPVDVDSEVRVLVDLSDDLCRFAKHTVNHPRVGSSGDFCMVGVHRLGHDRCVKVTA